MGWLYTGKSKSELIEELTRAESDSRRTLKTLAHFLRDNVLWAVIEVTAKESYVGDLEPGQSKRIIYCFLLEYDGSTSGWGYKAMCEQDGPFYYSCPMKYLKMVPEVDKAWRDEVRKHHRDAELGGFNWLEVRDEIKGAMSE